MEFPELPNVHNNTAANGSTLTKDSQPASDAGGGGCGDDSSCIEVDRITCYWDHVEYLEESTTAKKRDSSSTLQQPSLLALKVKESIKFYPGELTFIVGSVGSGKSALLQALVGELPVYTGVIHRRYNNSVAYASQEPWIMDGTVRENIILGHKFDNMWYDQVVTACGLSVDFTQLVAGDETIVGDRGVQLSGGQRARIGLARALYSNVDVLVADDPLSAVDAKVGRLIFDEAIQGLMVSRGKCVILASHQHQYIGESRCVLMEKGQIACIGSYDDCIEASGGSLTGHVADTAVDNLESDAGRKVKEPLEKEQGIVGHEVETIDKAGDIKDDGKEQNVQGVVQFETYVEYARAMGSIWLAFFMLILMSATQACVLASFALMGRWAERPAEDQVCLVVQEVDQSVLVKACFLQYFLVEIYGHHWFDHWIMWRDCHTGIDSSQNFLLSDCARVQDPP